MFAHIRYFTELFSPRISTKLGNVKGELSEPLFFQDRELTIQSPCHLTTTHYILLLQMFEVHKFGVWARKWNFTRINCQIYGVQVKHTIPFLKEILSDLKQSSFNGHAPFDCQTEFTTKTEFEIVINHEVCNILEKTGLLKGIEALGCVRDFQSLECSPYIRNILIHLLLFCFVSGAEELNEQLLNLFRFYLGFRQKQKMLKIKRALGLPHLAQVFSKYNIHVYLP